MNIPTGFTNLDLAALRFDAKAVRTELRCGANPNAADGNQRTPLACLFAGFDGGRESVRQSRVQALRLLLDAGANLDHHPHRGVPLRALIPRSLRGVVALFEAEQRAQSLDGQLCALLPPSNPTPTRSRL